MSTGRKIQGRLLYAEDIERIKALLKEHPEWLRTRLSRELCREWKWYDTAGRMKDMACRNLLLKLARRGEIALPRANNRDANRSRGKNFQPCLHDTTTIEGNLKQVAPIRVEPIEDEYHHRLWETYLRLYHYLGLTTKVGRTISYFAYDRNKRILGGVLFGASAWSCAGRDKYIGWDVQERENGLQEVVNNSRFLILPWVRIPHLASHILGKVSGRIGRDWQAKYGHPIYLLETFVEKERFSGTCYRAANWTYVGDTTGRTKNDKKHTIKASVKAVYVYPLTKNFRTCLCRRQQPWS